MLTTGARIGNSFDARCRVHLDAEPVTNLAEHPILAIPIEQAARSHDYWYAPERDALNPYLAAFTSADDLRSWPDIMADMLAGTTFNSLMTLQTAGERIAGVRPQGREAIDQIAASLRRNDLRITECISNANGDRTFPPGKQPDSDAYVHVAERRSDDVVIRGPKLPGSLAAIGHELMIISTTLRKSMALPESIKRGLSLPAICAPMSFVSGPDLARECCKAGIVGTFPRHNAASEEEFEQWLIDVRRDLDAHEENGGSVAPLAVNASLRSSEDSKRFAAACKRARVNLVISAFGDPTDHIARVHDWGGLAFHDVTNIRFAEKALRAGADGLIAIGAGRLTGYYRAEFLRKTRKIPPVFYF